MSRSVLLLALLGLVLGACSKGETAAPTASARSAGASVRPFCHRLQLLDEQLRLVRSIGDAQASVAGYVEGSASLDRDFRRAQEVAPRGVDLAPIEYANGRLDEIVRAMSPDLPGADARAQVALILAAYDDAMLKTLLSACGPSSVGA